MYTARNLKIVLIDDDPQMSEMLRDFFDNKFPSSILTSFTTGESALAELFDVPDFIILDYYLDSKNPLAMNGLQILKKLNERFTNVPIVFLSGQEKAEVAANTMKYGAYDYVVKNENAFHRLEILLNNILGQSQLKKNLGTQKFFNILLLILVVGMLIGFIIMKIIH